jgi:hypothetical protein
MHILLLLIGLCCAQGGSGAELLGPGHRVAAQGLYAEARLPQCLISVYEHHFILIGIQ